MTRADFIWWYLRAGFWITVVGIIATLGCLAVVDYPRTHSHSRVEDAVKVGVSMVVAVILWWAIWSK